ncbi:MAG: carbon-nitrogen hydrolase family protein, partial [Chitinophagaceae bacterium]|nr:carbon-nitrogen hydrolase family protein [Rubrivivax sp.]
QTAVQHGVCLVGGTLPVRLPSPADDAAPTQVLNRCCVFGPDGVQAAHYDKLHLFAFDNGRESYDEGRTLQAGGQTVALDAPTAEGVLRIGLSICYDLRFPELYRALMHPPCDLLCVPSAFTYTTGQAHWELLLRARAVENQCYVLAPAQGGQHVNGRRTWGHSMVVDPWGEVLAVRQDEGEGVLLAEVDTARIAEVRKQLPALRHRRSQTPTPKAVKPS